MQSKDKLKSGNTLFENIKYWYVDDVVRETRLAKKTVYNLCSLGEMPHLKQRKRLVFIPDEIRKWNAPKGK
jgi:hypothetical protein